MVWIQKVRIQVKASWLQTWAIWENCRPMMWSIRILVKIRVSRKLKINRCEDFTQLATCRWKANRLFVYSSSWLLTPPHLFLTYFSFKCIDNHSSIINAFYHHVMMYKVMPTFLRFHFRTFLFIQNYKILPAGGFPTFLVRLPIVITFHHYLKKYPHHIKPWIRRVLGRLVFDTVMVIMLMQSHNGPPWLMRSMATITRL